MRTTALLLLMLTVVPDTVSAGSRNMVVIFDGTSIRMTDKFDYVPVRNASDIKRPKVDCSFYEKRTKCWQLRKARKNEPYGSNLRFVNPIVVLPNWGRNNEELEIEPQNRLTTSKSPVVITSKLPEFDFRSWAIAKQLFDAPPEEFLNVDDSLGFEHSEHVYAPVDKTIGGPELLTFWRGLVGKRPTTECFDPGEACSIVLPAKRNGQEALAYCAIANTSAGLGLPYSCFFVAFMKSGRWFISALDGPKDWGGGGAVGLECGFSSSKSLEEISQFFLSVLKNEKTNIELIEHKRTNDSVSFAGKKIAADSKFYKGYYEKASAHYTVSGSDGGFEVSGTFVLVISATRSSVDTDYREIGEINWFQDQMLRIIQDRFAKKIGSNVGCQNNGL